MIIPMPINTNPCPCAEPMPAWVTIVVLSIIALKKIVKDMPKGKIIEKKDR